jgi:peroxiredoxin
LEALYKKYKDQGLVILGFPCNQFGGQEPGAEAEIVQFCSLNFGVSFPIMEKVDVNGDGAHPLWEWLKSEKSQLGMSRIKWNFEKFLVDKEGWVHDRYASTTTPSGLEKPIEELLK